MYFFNSKHKKIIIYVIIYVVGDKMRRKVEHYNGKTISRKVLNRINLIDLKIIQEGITQFEMAKLKSVKALCKEHDTTKEQEHIIIGEDWYIIYTEISEEEIEIKDWMAIHNVENKLTQTMEMYSALKNILLEHKDCYIEGMLRHSTSYPFYQKILDNGYIEEICDVVAIYEDTEEIEQIKQQIFSQYDSYEEYLQDESRNKYESVSLDDYIYHEVSFTVTNAFINKYKHSGRK